MKMKKDQTSIDLALMAQSINYIQNDVKDIKDKLEADYVTRAEMVALTEKIKQLQSIVYGFVGLILLGFGGVLVNYFIRKPI